MKQITKKIVGVIAIGSMSLNMFACGSSSGGNNESEKNNGNSKYEGQTLVVLGYGGTVQEAMEKAWFEPFEKEYGVTIESVSPPDSGQLTAMGESGKCDYDLLINDPQNILKWADLGYMEKIDYEKIDKSKFGESYYSDYWVAADIYTTSICWNTNDYDNDTAPSNWEEFWNVAKEKNVTMYNYPMLTLESALLADGVAVDEMYPLDTDRAFKKLDEIKKNVRVWYDSGEQSVQALTSGEVAAGGLWVGRALSAKDNGDPVDVTFNQSIVGIDAFAVMKGCENADLAMELIAYCTTAEAGARFMEEYPYGVVNDAAYDLIDDETLSKLCVNPSYRDSQLVIDYEYWKENCDALVEEWNSWILN